MFERIDYEVKRIDGDYAYLQNMENRDEELKLSLIHIFNMYVVLNVQHQ